MIDKRKRHIVSLEKMPADVRAAFNENYPGGIEECEDDIQLCPKPNGEVFYAVTIDLPEDIYLVRIPVEVDSLEDVQKWLEAEPDGGAPDTEPEDNTLPDDNISQYKGDDDSDDE